MIPVVLQPEPVNFDADVRQPGQQWLIAKGIALNAIPPDPSKLPTHWRAYNKVLWNSYGGVCAYLAIYFEWPLGAYSTEHFVAKSQHAGMAYEWDNYRLASLGPNRKKNKFDDVLDPIGLAPNTFILNLASGKIRVNPLLVGQQLLDAEATMKRLKLKDPILDEMRYRHFFQYVSGRIDAAYFEEHSPFVWYEAQRQNLL